VDRKDFDVGGYFTNGSNWLQLHPSRIVSRCSYLVNRKKILKHTILVGLEVELSATSEGRKPGYVVNPEVYQS